MLHQKRDDSINPIIRKTPRISQRLHARFALRKRGCGFYAANLATSGCVPGRGCAGAESRPRRGHRAATNVDRRL